MGNYFTQARWFTVKSMKVETFSSLSHHQEVKILTAAITEINQAPPESVSERIALEDNNQPIEAQTKSGPKNKKQLEKEKQPDQLSKLLRENAELQKENKMLTDLQHKNVKTIAEQSQEIERHEKTIAKQKETIFILKEDFIQKNLTITTQREQLAEQKADYDEKRMELEKLVLALQEKNQEIAEELKARAPKEFNEHFTPELIARGNERWHLNTSPSFDPDKHNDIIEWKGKDKVLIREVGALDEHSILWIESGGGHITFVCMHGVFKLVRYGLNKLYDTYLSDRTFLKAHRSLIINLAQIKEVKLVEGVRTIVFLENSKKKNEKVVINRPTWKSFKVYARQFAFPVTYKKL